MQDRHITISIIIIIMLTKVRVSYIIRPSSTLILLQYVSFPNARDNIFCFTLTFVSELFSNYASRSTINFIRELGFYCKI